MFENNVHLLGRLTADPEVKTVGNDIKVCHFTVAVNRPAKKGEHPETDFINCTAWRQSAELLENYFAKGDRIGVEGALRVDKYETKQGEKRNRVEVQADRIVFIEKKGEPTAATKPAKTIVPSDFADDDDDLPI